MTRHDVGQAVEKAIREIIDPPKDMTIAPGQSLMDDLWADELDFSEITLELEEILGIEFPDEILDSHASLTVGKLTTMCVDALSEQGRMDEMEVR